MERLSRSINAPIITSVDHIHLLNKDICLGTCEEFSVQYCDTDIYGSYKKRRRPIIIFNGCNSNAHLTIILRSKFNKNILKKLKNILRLSIHTYYNHKLEISLLTDMNCYLPKTILDKYKNIQNQNNKYEYLNTNPFILHHDWSRNLYKKNIDKYLSKNNNTNL